MNLLWPFFGISSGGGHSGLRVFPIYSHVKRENRLANYSLFWPLAHWGWSDLDKEDPGSHFVIFPIYGQSQGRGLQSWTVFPPFGYAQAKNENTGYRSYDILWPLIKIERGGNQPERTRFLPFFAFFDGQEVKSRVFLWPLIWIREDKNIHYTRNSVYVLPFWHNWQRTGKNGETSGYWQAWPLAHREYASNGEGDLAFPSPLLFRHKAPRMDENWSPLFTLFRQRTGQKGESSTRLAANLFRREKGNGEDRISVPILFGYREKKNGESEWSFLAGLLRFRSGASGVEMMNPSFPGPGWDE